jgi:hypothetical protein
MEYPYATKFTMSQDLVDSSTTIDIGILHTGELCMDYGYKSGDLIHYKISDKSLDEGLRLL